MTKKMINQFSR